MGRYPRAEGDMKSAVAHYLKAVRHSKLNGRAHTLVLVAGQLRFGSMPVMRSASGQRADALSFSSGQL